MYFVNYFNRYRTISANEGTRTSILQFDVESMNKEVINKLQLPTYGDSNYGFPTGLQTACQSNHGIAFTCSYDSIGNRIGPFSIFDENGKMEYSGELDENQKLSSICKYESDVIYKWKRNYLYDDQYEYCCVFEDGKSLYFHIKNTLAHGKCKVVQREKGSYVYYRNGKNVSFLKFYWYNFVDFIVSLMSIFFLIVYCANNQNPTFSSIFLNTNILLRQFYIIHGNNFSILRYPHFSLQIQFSSSFPTSLPFLVSFSCRFPQLPSPVYHTPPLTGKQPIHNTQSTRRTV